MHLVTKERIDHVYISDLHPDIFTPNACLAGIIQWADANPHAWQIVTRRKSKAFGVASCEYIGWAQRAMDSEAVLERLRHFHELVTGNAPFMNPNSIFVWRAQFTFSHYNNKGFTGGFFQQHDERYPRCCLTLDYTPDTKELVLDRFCSWIDRHYQTTYISIDKKLARSMGVAAHG